MKNVVIGILAGAGLVLAPPVLAGDHAYVGAAKCKMCHSSAAKGAQYPKWAESKHSKAYAALATEEAKKFGEARGVTDPQKDPKCLKCHVSGFDAPPAQRLETWKAEDGVGCESCHGPGGDYWKMTVMKDKNAAIAAGLKIPDEKTCRGCHNPESPSYKEFDYKSFHEKIAHPLPAK